ncbi:MAG: hypothetical protein M1833_002822 [Piccolia ochrophora]|nr:MAG: hypothetical protein M1833_002822 [Piccolia ochrophora]
MAEDEQPRKPDDAGDTVGRGDIGPGPEQLYDAVGAQPESVNTATSSIETPKGGIRPTAVGLESSGSSHGGQQPTSVDIHSTMRSSQSTQVPSRDSSTEFLGGYFVAKGLHDYSSPNSFGSRSPVSSLPSAEASSTSISALMSQNQERNKLQPPFPTLRDAAGVEHDASNVSSQAISPPVGQDAVSSLNAVSSNNPDLHALESARTARTVEDYPAYPNQAFSALQYQYRPPSHIPHALPHFVSRQPPYTSHSTSTSSRRRSQGPSHSEKGSRTAGHTPVSSPGIFASKGPKTPALVTADGSIQNSPPLHWPQRQRPKETHIADVDIDPISGRKLLNQYEIIAELGRGVHGKVKLGRNLEKNEDVAIKIVNRYSKRRRLGKLGDPEDKVKKEVAILKKTIHPNVVSLLELIDDPAKQKVYIVLEYVEHGEILWRTKGRRDIVAIERQRIESSSQGMTDNSNLVEEERVLRDAEKWIKSRDRYRAWHHEAEAGGLQSSLEMYANSQGDASSERPESQRSASVSIIAHDDEDGAPASSSNFTGPELYTEVPEETHCDSLATSVHASPSSPQGVETAFDVTSHETWGDRTPSVAGSYVSHMSADVPYDVYEEDFSYVPCLSISQARQTFRDTVLGLEYLHYQGIIHRDIKPANLLWTSDYHVKISDFGVSYLGRPIRDDDATEDVSESDARPLDEAVELAKTVGTPAFYSPELCYTDLTMPRPPVTGQIDIWALGVTLYCLIYARLPFRGLDEFSLFKSISEDRVHIPRKRLKAVRPRGADNVPSIVHEDDHEHRRDDELVYEDIDDDLYDLLRRILEKDPTKRITLREIKRHPFVLHDMSDPISWIDETDPARQNDGRKIEVSNEDVEKAVVPIGLLERVRSGMRRMGAAIGFGKAREGRRRARSGAVSAESISSTKSGSPTATIREGPPTSLRDESLSTLPRTIFENEHPLAQSVTAAPEPSNQTPLSQGSGRRSMSTGGSPARIPAGAGDGAVPRPNPLERTVSTAESTRTVKPLPLENRSAVSSPGSPGLPGNPTAVWSTHDTNLGALLGSAARRSLSARSRAPTQEPNVDLNVDSRTSSADRIKLSNDRHCGPSIAISGALASGRVDAPTVFREEIFPSPAPSPANESSSSDAPDMATPQPLRSTSVLRDPNNRLALIASQDDRPITAPADERRGSQARHNDNVKYESTAESFAKAQDELFRRRQLEIEMSQDRSRSAAGGIPGAASLDSCPPSPDDEAFVRSQRDAQFTNQGGSLEDRIQSSIPKLPHPLISSSSEDQFTSGISQSASHPSIPSVISPSSSIATDDPLFLSADPEYSSSSRHKLDTITPPSPQLQPDLPSVVSEDDLGYNGDHAAESGDDSPDSDEDFLVMIRRKTRLEGSGRSESVSNAQLALRHSRRSSRGTTRSTRSGSSGTLRKAVSNDTGEHGRNIDTTLTE